MKKRTAHIVFAMTAACLLLKITSPVLAEDPDRTPENERIRLEAGEEWVHADELHSGEVTAGSCGGNAVWSFDSETGIVTISGEGPLYDYGPADEKWYKSFNSSIKEIVVESGITRIGSYFFYDCTNAVRISLPASVTSFGTSAFDNHSSDLTFITPIGSAAVDYANNAVPKIKVLQDISSVQLGNLFAVYNETGAAVKLEGNGMELSVWSPGTMETLKKGKDYTLSYANNILPGTATVTVTGKGNYTGKKTQEFTIVHDLGFYPEDEGTCYENGHKAFYLCLVCGKVFSDENGTIEMKDEDIATPMLPHTIDIIPGTPPTEEQTGLTEGKVCLVCGKIIEKQKVIPKLTPSNEGSASQTGESGSGSASQTGESGSGSASQTGENGTGSSSGQEESQTGSSSQTAVSPDQESGSSGETPSDKKAGTNEDASAVDPSGTPAETAAEAGSKPGENASSDKGDIPSGINVPAPDTGSSKTAADPENSPADSGTVAGITAVITGTKSDADLKGSDFLTLRAAASKVTKNSVTLSWKKVKGAKGYIVYGARRGKKFEKLAQLSGKKKSYTHKGLKKGTYYKYIVAAFKKVNGVQKVICTSRNVVAATSGGKYTNYSSLNVSARRVTLARKEKKKITAKAVNSSGTLKVKKYRAVKFETSNRKIAAVSKNGVITAKKKGVCYIYAYAQNGIYKRIKVTVVNP